MTIIEATIYLLQNKISGAQKALILFLIYEIFFNAASSIFYKHWKKNWRIMPIIIEEHLQLQRKFKRFNDVIWFSLAFVILGLTVFGFQEPIQIPVCVFGIGFTFLLHEWCAYLVGGIKQTCLEFTYNPNYEDFQ